jgi:hypothetical protein
LVVERGGVGTGGREPFMAGSDTAGRGAVAFWTAA